MARSPLTLAAAVTAALPGAEVVGARTLSANAEGRFDSAVATLADGREIALRVAEDDDAARELAAEALALRALTAGARAMLPFDAPEYVGETRVGDQRALATTLLPGFQVEGADVPAGRGAATSLGRAIAAVHTLPASVVRAAGLAERTADELRDEIARLIDTAAATGEVPARLTARWRDAVADDALWRFAPTVVLGGVQAASFVFRDDDVAGPQVTGLVHWHGLALGDPAADLAWTSSAPDAAADVRAAYAGALGHAPDAALSVRSRLLAELDYARWLVHGDALRRPDIVADAAGLLASLAETVGAGDLTVPDTADGVDSALDALDSVPSTPAAPVRTGMETDAYSPEDLFLAGAEADADATEDLSDARLDDATVPNRAGSGEQDGEDADEPGAADGAESPTSESGADALSPEDEAQRAARAALQRWRSSDSE